MCRRPRNPGYPSLCDTPQDLAGVPLRELFPLQPLLLGSAHPSMMGLSSTLPPFLSVRQKQVLPPPQHLTHFVPRTHARSSLVLTKSALTPHLPQCLAYSRLSRGLSPVFTKASSRQQGTKMVQLVCAAPGWSLGERVPPRVPSRTTRPSTAMNTERIQVLQWHRNAVTSSAATPQPRPQARDRKGYQCSSSV